MATSSFNKDFILKSKKEVESFIKILEKTSKPIKIDKNLVSPEKEKEGVEKLKKIFSH
ncbi:hypothetical protein Marpi_1156 [Marinitoga piezophila KA3]|uniref:Uncharacterized protein n=1 Tax=Marinitoga piezophila (strain DSM 14283 / JCM 11233 / KA3) TaxID=443254 RepID=H2J882_MARPK|nr:MULTISPECIES: hypothetical protein [Marinitoga]AEX85566.1 hypothetical protein Marpi_1156 [Marinitoga piezophila KA3]